MDGPPAPAALVELVRATVADQLHSEQTASLKALASQVDINLQILNFMFIFLLQAGFTALEVGVVRHKNVRNILIKNLMDAVAGAFTWYIAGYALSFGGESCLLGDIGFGYESADREGGEHGRARPLHWLTQLGFAITSSTIISGCMAERTHIAAYLAYTCFNLCFMYPVAARAAWSTHGLFSGNSNCGGAALGRVIDFAGGGVVHINGGMAGLMGALVVGPRAGRFGENGEVRDFAEHTDIAWNVIGSLLLWTGWYGFNTTGAVHVGDEEWGAVVARIGVNTTLAPATAALVVVIVSWYHKRFINVPATVNGVLAGLVSITAGCATLGSLATIATGAAAGLVYYLSSLYVKRLRIDDAMDGFAVHACGGALGVLVAGLASERRFASPQPYPLYDGVAKQLPIQIAFVLFVATVSGVCGFLFLRAFRYASECCSLPEMRVGRRMEEEGLDRMYLLEEETQNLFSSGTCVLGGREATFVVEQYAANSPIEDRFHAVITNAVADADNDMVFFGLYDGHHGASMSAFLDENLHNLVFSSLELFDDTDEGLRFAFSQVDDLWANKIRSRFMDGEVDLALAGSCALVSLVRSNTLYVANTGDSRAIIVWVDAAGKLCAHDMSNDHNVGSEGEVAALEARHPGERGLLGDGRQRRVKGRLKVTRSLGDMYLKDASFNQLPLPPLIQVKAPFHPPYIYTEPEIVSKKLEPSDRFVLLATDGLWDHITNSDILDIMQDTLISATDRVAVDTIPSRLVHLSLTRASESHNIEMTEMLLKAGGERRNFHDDISIVLLYLPFVAAEGNFGSVQRHYSRAARAQADVSGRDGSQNNSVTGSAESEARLNSSRVNLLADNTGSSQNSDRTGNADGGGGDADADGARRDRLGALQGRRDSSARGGEKGQIKALEALMVVSMEGPGRGHVGGAEGSPRKASGAGFRLTAETLSPVTIRSRKPGLNLTLPNSVEQMKQSPGSEQGGSPSHPSRARSTSFLASLSASSRPQDLPPERSMRNQSSSTHETSSNPSHELELASGPITRSRLTETSPAERSEIERISSCSITFQSKYL